MFRFTIRDVLWLMVVVGLGVSWFASHQRAERLQLAHDALALKRKETEALHDDAVRKLNDAAANVRRAKAERDEAVKYWRDMLGRPQKGAK